MPTELLVQLPDDLKAFFKESGYEASTYMENRTNARLRVRDNCEIKFIFMPPALIKAYPRATGRVLIKNLSKRGIGVLYHQQLFPREQFQLALHGRLLRATVVRCRRLAEACYEIGGRVELLEIPGS